jgi:nucleoside-diphosphate-sugar epimerase
MNNKLLSFGHGYSAHALERLLPFDDWKILATTRSLEKSNVITNCKVSAFIWPGTDLVSEIKNATHILLSIPPNMDGDPVFLEYGNTIASSKNLKWIGYLSTTGVYGDHRGGWVDENTPLKPTTERGIKRVLAERQWLELAKESSLPLNIFRLAGIYGLGRGPFSKVLAGTAKRIIKKGQVFSRIHVDDIAQILLASINKPNLTGVYNVCDDLSAPPEDVLSYAAELLKKEIPPEIDFLDADMSEMARSFYAESKRVHNKKIKTDLGVVLKYVNYKEGLNALFNHEFKQK